VTDTVGWGWRAAHVAALSGIAVTQPILGILGDNPTFFVAHGAGPGAVLAVALLVTLLVPALVLGVEALASLVRPSWGWTVHLVAIGLLGGLFAAAVLEDVLGVVLDDLSQVSEPLSLVGAAAAGFLLARAYRQRSMVRSTLSYLAVAPLAFLFLFAFASPAHDLLFPTSVAAADVDLSAQSPPIVVLVVDELPLASVLDRDAEAIDATRFPNLARLAADGTWYPDATSVAAYTHEAVPAILTGREVHDDNLPPTPSGHPDTLFTLLADDYEIEATEQLTQLCTDTICDSATGGPPGLPFDVLLDDLGVVAGRVALPAMLDDWLPTVDDTWANFGQGAVDLDEEADELAEDREEFVESLGEQDRVGGLRDAIASVDASTDPRLTFIHTVFPHIPWTFLPDGTPYPDIGNPGLVENGWTTEEAGDRALQRHLLQAQFADELVGELLDRLEAIDVYDDALVVLTADHGASFATGTHRRLPEAASLPGVMPVPMIVKLPTGEGSPGQVDDRPAQTVDLLPTIADALGVEVPWEIDGRSLLGPPPEPGERSISAHGDTTSTTDDPLDYVPIVDRIWDRFGRGDRLQLYGLGPGAELIGEDADGLAVGDSGRSCWVPDGGVGWVGGHLEGTDEATDLVLTVDGTVVGTAPTFDDGEHAQAVFVLGDPAAWHEDAEVALWRLGRDGDDNPLLITEATCD
jgi:hypothetical protein